MLLDEVLKSNKEFVEEFDEVKLSNRLRRS